MAATPSAATTVSARASSPRPAGRTFTLPGAVVAPAGVTSAGTDWATVRSGLPSVALVARSRRVTFLFPPAGRLGSRHDTVRPLLTAPPSLALAKSNPSGSTEWTWTGSVDAV